MRWELKRAIVESGKTQAGICDELTDVGIEISEVKLSRVVTGVTRVVPGATQLAISYILGNRSDTLFDMK